MRSSLEGIRDSQSFSRAWYSAPIAEFLQTSKDEVLGRLTRNGQFSLLPTQKDAWITQIDILRSALVGLDGLLLLEFNIPRMGRRIDAVLLIGPAVFAVEFKVGGVVFDQAAIDQVWDYALDLKNFHEASHALPIIPIVVATEATNRAAAELEASADGVYYPLLISPNSLRCTIDLALSQIHGEPVNQQYWAHAPYRPTPTIVEAARALYAQHSVEAIARFDAGARNLHETSRRIEELVDEAKALGRKIICFVTGVPGAGKTLVGLNLATRRRDVALPTHAVFLSGNGPLVAVLSEALARDEVIRRKMIGEQVKKGHVTESIKAFIQNVHHFRDEALDHPGPPHEHVVIFDEAQRAWNLHQTANFMLRKKNYPGFAQSEPEFLVSYMERLPDWAVVVCLVGGGQEINTGEAGITAWLDAVREKFPAWHMYISSRLTDAEYASGNVLDSIRSRENVHFDNCLHLAVSMRSFRAENVSSFVKALLDCKADEARNLASELDYKYPIRITRNLTLAKQWIRQKARGSERFGLIASSKAQRLKPHAVDVRVPVNPVHWFLNDRTDTRSSWYLEDAATEFQVQGLELDWACVTWDGDLRFKGDSWSFHDFRGSRWCRVNNEDNQRYLRNAYRVLLTRARQGMVIFVPPGDVSDPTRLPEFYDSTFRYLEELGIESV